MKLNELILSFKIYTTNEEDQLLDQLTSPAFYESFEPRQQVVIDNLVKKSLITKVRRSSGYVVVKNEF